MSIKITIPNEETLAEMFKNAQSCQDMEMCEMYAEITYLRLAVADLRKRLNWSWTCHANLKDILNAEKDELDRVITWYNGKLDAAYTELSYQTGFKYPYQKLNNTTIAPEWFDSVERTAATTSPVHDSAENIPQF